MVRGEQALGFGGERGRDLGVAHAPEGDEASCFGAPEGVRPDDAVDVEAFALLKGARGGVGLLAEDAVGRAVEQALVDQEALPAPDVGPSLRSFQEAHASFRVGRKRLVSQQAVGGAVGRTTTLASLSTKQSRTRSAFRHLIRGAGRPHRVATRAPPRRTVSPDTLPPNTREPFALAAAASPPPTRCARRKAGRRGFAYRSCPCAKGPSLMAANWRARCAQQTYRRASAYPS